MPPASIRHRLLSRLAVPAALLGLAGLLTGCSQVAIIKSAQVQASYDSARGNNPLAAADGASLQEALRVRAQVWSLRIDATPPEAGSVDVRSAQAVRSGRGKFTAVTLTLRASAQATIEGFSSRGQQGEQVYCESLVQSVAQAGYTGMRSIHVEVYFNNSHHATLSWQATTGFVYTVLDGK
jgi:hypothetical protein